MKSYGYAWVRKLDARSFIAFLSVLLLASLLSSSGVGADLGDPCGSGLQKMAEDSEVGVLCGHGADPVKDAKGASLFLPDSGAVSEAPCVGDGVSGFRIEVIYGVPSDESNNYDASVAEIRNAVAFADSYFAQSDPNADQHLRWLCDTDGKVVVHNVTLAAIGDDGEYTFSDMYSSLTKGPSKGKKASAFKRTDRVYVTFVDGIGGAYPYCGQASIDRDDSGSLRNKNNTGPAYSLIACWNGYVTLHEIGHNLGSVQLSAPHSSGKWHCYDEFDVMCYKDGGPYFVGPDGESGTSDDRSLETVCIDPFKLPLDSQDRQFDCNLDDYYNPNPPPGSYLATRWNLSNSNWVQKAAG